MVRLGSTRLSRFKAVNGSDILVSGQQYQRPVNSKNRNVVVAH
ncbi:hypothetical protein Hdeb2414_s0024g00654441 [Helianthus debilis subsp. tardiflorus]